MTNFIPQKALKSYIPLNLLVNLKEAYLIKNYAILLKIKTKASIS